MSADLRAISLLLFLQSFIIYCLENGALRDCCYQSAHGAVASFQPLCECVCRKALNGSRKMDKFRQSPTIIDDEMFLYLSPLIVSFSSCSPPSIISIHKIHNLHNINAD